MNNHEQINLGVGKPKWAIEIREIRTVIHTPNNCSWWFRFWVKFFFNAKWTKL